MQVQLGAIVQAMLGTAQRAGATGFARVIVNAMWWRMVASFPKEGVEINRFQCPLPDFRG